MQTTLNTTRENYDSSPNGLQCTFLKIGSTGIKVYTSAMERDFAYANQLRLHNMGLAPLVGYKCDVKIGGDNNYNARTGYAFETGIAEVFDKKYWKGLDDDDAAIYRNRFEIGCRDLADKLASEGITWLDDHCGNVGFDPDTGESVLIDCADDIFGDGSIGLDALC